MSDQRDLFSEEAFARRTDPDTSWESAKRLPASRLEKKILRTFHQAPNGRTIKEATKLCGCPEISVSPRFKPMMRNGLIYDSDERRMNRETGRNAIVWKLTLIGQRVLEELTCD